MICLHISVNDTHNINYIILKLLLIRLIYLALLNKKKHNKKQIKNLSQLIA